jgi:serine/threonine-protein kinase
VAITEALVLSRDAILVPVSELPETVRKRFKHVDGDFALTHPRLRAPSSILDARSAELVQLFRTPLTVVDAVIRFSRSREADPEAILEEACPLLERLVNAGFLVAEGSAEAAGILPSLMPGERVGGFEVRECVQELEDTDVYQARGPGGLAALKIERRPAASSRLEWEAAVLEHLGGEVSPRLLGTGELEGRRYLAMEWCSGVAADAAAWELRRRGPAGLLSLCRSLCAAYARLHERGVIHGDVHLRNTLVDRGGTVRLVDFGLARWDAAPAGLRRPWRAGVPFFHEPEYAVAMLSDTPPPEASAAGEQYAVGALLYFLLTGTHYRDFLLDREEMLRQIGEEPPLPFAERGAEPWPEIERVLARALAKSPQERFPSMAGLAEALETCAPACGSPTPAQATAAEGLLARVLLRLEPQGELFREGFKEPPRASVTYGAAGAACALYRIALAREDAELLSQADLWAARALAYGDAEDGFYDPGKGITREVVGRISPYHTATGPAAVQALIAHAAGLPNVQRSALEAFVAAARQPCDNPDLTLGRSGVLLAASLLHDACGSLEGQPVSNLRGVGDELFGGLWDELDGRPAVDDLDSQTPIGLAHGWAGYLYASLRWCRSVDRPLPARFAERLSALADCARPWGRGLRWRWYDAGGAQAPASMPGWCNGSAGYVFLFSLAHRMLGDPTYRVLAEGAAWNAWEAVGAGTSLCCGLAGRSYALLHLYRHGGGREWLKRARDLAERAAQEAPRSPEPADSLYKGALGVAVLAADLARPEDAAMPFFEEEGWV